MNEISDGKLYGSNDMVKADCGDCEGCSACCRGMGTSIVLDPLDVNRLACGLQMTFEELLSENVELNVVDGLILPNLKMVEEKCGFLNEEGRCCIHPIRPGICRLFPLGRYYENGGFRYFLQVNECRKENRSKVKVKKWIDIPDMDKNRKFINQWHGLQKEMQDRLAQCEEVLQKNLTLQFLKIFYLTPYTKDDFYAQFESRYRTIRSILQ